MGRWLDALYPAELVVASAMPCKSQGWPPQVHPKNLEPIALLPSKNNILKIPLGLHK